MARDATYKERVEANTMLVQEAVETLLADAEERQRVGAYGRQTVMLLWENGFVSLVEHTYSRQRKPPPGRQKS